MKHMYDICNSAKVCKMTPCGCGIIAFDVYNAFFL